MVLRPNLGGGRRVIFSVFSNDIILFQFVKDSEFDSERYEFD